MSVLSNYLGDQNNYEVVYLSSVCRKKEKSIVIDHR